MTSVLATEPKRETVLVDPDGRWTRSQYLNRTEFHRYDKFGNQASHMSFFDPDAELLRVDGRTMLSSDGYLYSLLLQRVLASSRMEFESGDVVYYGGFRRREYLQYDEIGMLKVVGIPPWIAPHDLEFEIVGDLALTHISTEPQFTVQAFLFSVERGFHQLFDMQARECQPGRASLDRDANGNYFVDFNGKRLEYK